MYKNTLTTYEIAQHCQVTPRTVIQWINEGKLTAYRTPGNHSRVSIEEFVSFLKKYNMPIPKEFESASVVDLKRVLIVDDDKDLVALTKRFLLFQKNYAIEVAFDGFEAGEKFVSFKPHLILLDIQMPGMNGYGVCSRIRSNPENKNVKILFISGNTDDEAINEMKKVGADAFLPKPFDMDSLKEKIEELLSIKGGGRA